MEDGRLTMAAGGRSLPGAQGRRERVDRPTADKLGRLVDQGDEQVLDDSTLEMIVSSANLDRRRRGSAEELTLEDVKAWIFWRQLNPPEAVPPEPEPEPLDAKFKIKIGFGGRPVDVASVGSQQPEYDEEFHVDVRDDAVIKGVDQPRSITVWRLGGATDADAAVSSGVLHGCRAVRCHLPPGAFKLELASMPANIPDGQERSGSYFFLPAPHQSSEELVAFFNRCGSDPPRVYSGDRAGGMGAQHPSAAEAESPSLARTSYSMASMASTESVRTLRGFEVPEVPTDRPQIAGADVQVLSTKITGTEQAENLKGRDVTHYLIECTPVPVPDQALDPWVVRKRYSQFDEFRKELEAADSSSEVDTLGLKGVPFPAKTWGVATVGEGTVALRQQKLEEWLNKIVGLNNALLCSDHHELADAVQRFLRPENDSMSLTMDQLQSAAVGGPVQSDGGQREQELLAQQVVTETSWRADQLTGEDGYLQNFEHRLFPSLTTRGDGEEDCGDHIEDSVVQELQQLLASASSGKDGLVGKSEADRLVRSVQAALRDRDETISQLEMQRDKLQRQLDGAAAIATENSIALLSALGKGQLAKALAAASEEEATG